MEVRSRVKEDKKLFIGYQTLSIKKISHTDA